LTISCTKEGTRYSLTSLFFKDYRQLALQLEKEGLNVGTIGEDESDVASTTGEKTRSAGSMAQAPVPAAATIAVEADFPPFPRTFARSSFGLKLSESDLQERAEGLDRWMRALCQRYHLMTEGVQVRQLLVDLSLRC
jgi:hypothetical protein